MKFLNKAIQSFSDLPNHTSLIFHSLEGCNFHCYKCHNYKELIQTTPQNYWTEEEVYKQIELNGFLFDSIILSGGEFLKSPLSQVITLLQHIRKIYEGLIIVTTNGTYPDKVQTLMQLNLVDGFHVDCKLPYHILPIEGNQDIYKKIIGIIPTQEMIANILDTISLVIKSNSCYSQIRTVEYPILEKDFFISIEEYINQIKNIYSSQVPYFLNKFMAVDE